MKIFITFVFVFLSLLSSGQRVIKKIAGEICDCASEIDIKKNSPIEAEAELKKCYTGIVFYTKDLKKCGFNILVKKNMDSVASLLNNRLFAECPQYSELLFYIINPSADSVKSNITDSSDCRVLRKCKLKMLGTESDYVVENDEKFQIERDNDGNIKTKSEIIWVNDCEYILKLVSITSENEMEYIGKGSEVHVMILQIDNNIVKFKVQLDGFFMYGEMQIIE